MISLLKSLIVPITIVLMLIHCNSYGVSNMKLIALIALCLFIFIGTIIYYYNKEKSKNKFDIDYRNSRRK